MSMGAIGKAMKATRTQMLEAEAEGIAAEFTRFFLMRDGDYVRFRKAGECWRHGRIMSVESVYWNMRGGVTANITVAPLLASGRLGKTRGLTISVNANRGGLKGVHPYSEFERMPIAERHA